MTRTIMALITAAALLGALPGCGTSRSDLRVESSARPAALVPPFTTAVYIPIDGNTADIYLSDLPESVLTAPGGDLAGISGNIVHIHLFIVPRAGRTPIEPSACSSTMRHLIIADGQAGLYSGAGFLLPDRAPGGSTFSGSLRDATVRLQRSSEGFADLLGVASVQGSVSARRDSDLSRAIAAKIDAVIARLPAQRDTEPSDN